MTDPGDAPMLVLFDSHCVLCSGWVRFLLRHERGRRLHFVAAWSQTGLATAARHGFDARDLDRTYVVVADGVALVRSAAGLALLGRMRAPWHWLRWMRIVPRPIRDAVYDLVARRRYRWFGRSETCLVPDPGLRDRFTLE